MSAEGASRLPSVKVLIVDDRPENLVAIEALLRRDGLELVRASSGSQALELLLIHDFALAILDVQMPEMDGFELAELMRGTERTRGVPIIFLTAGAHDAQRVFRGYEIGAVDFLYKPVDVVLLRHKVMTFVELQRQRLEVRELLRLNEMFVAAISHDLRQPLSAIVMGASLLEPTVSGPGAQHTLARMRSGASRMTGMLDQLNDLARARLGGGISVDRRPVSLRLVTERVIEELQLAHDDRTLSVTFDDGDLVGCWDEQRLAQVLANLVSNGLRHGARGCAVDVRVSGAGACVVLEVHNAGEIPASLLDCLFDPFRAGRRAARDSLGLGLYIVRQLVEAHGGTVEVQSSAEVGVTFRVELPRSLAATALVAQCARAP